MIIQIANFPEEGIELEFSEKDGWVRQKLSRALGELHHAEDKVSGHLSVHKTMENLFVRASAHLPIHAVCGRCLSPYDYEIDVHCERLFTPLFESERERKILGEEEAELTKDDLDFSFFEGEEIDAGEILAEQILLDQPITYLCRSDCKGLCTTCGLNRNEQDCACASQKIQESPFSVLKNWKKNKA